MNGTGPLDLAYWQAGLLKADAADWITVLAYLLAALAALRAAGHGVGRERLFWRLCAAALFFLGVNELFDFQTLLTELGRVWARSQGLFEHRRAIQLAFVLALALAAALVGIVVMVFVRAAHVMVRVALAGMVFIGAFVLLRAASFHHLDELLGWGPGGFPVGTLQEIAGIVIVSFAATRYVRPAPARA